MKSESVLQVSQQELQQSREELRALAGQLLAAQEEDRRRISRDLHDDINQRLAMLSMDIQRMGKEPFSDPDMLRDELRGVSDRLTSLSDDVRQMAYRFHPSILDDLGLVKPCVVSSMTQCGPRFSAHMYIKIRRHPCRRRSPSACIEWHRKV